MPTKFSKLSSLCYGGVDFPIRFFVKLKTEDHLFHVHHNRWQTIVIAAPKFYGTNNVKGKPGLFKL